MLDERRIAKMSDIDGLKELMSLTARNVYAQSEQIGQLLGTVVELKQDFGSVKREISTIKDDLGDVKQELTVTRFQANRIQSAIYNRVAELLKLDFDGGKVANGSIEMEERYRGGFISRCYTDARRKSKLGTPYYATLRCDFKEVMEYIEAWEPEVKGGRDGYMQYLDIRREKRSDRRRE